mmetsp:Transcript_61044/g.167430  ORF Transcript_61044/g.167430 Transcript_61044/m.167430 type:complete len:222 (-) Transcript_61044:295-960(-)
MRRRQALFSTCMIAVLTCLCARRVLYLYAASQRAFPKHLSLRKRRLSQAAIAPVSRRGRVRRQRGGKSHPAGRSSKGHPEPSHCESAASSAKRRIWIRVLVVRVHGVGRGDHRVEVWGQRRRQLGTRRTEGRRTEGWREAQSLGTALISAASGGAHRRRTGGGGGGKWRWLKRCVERTVEEKVGGAARATRAKGARELALLDGPHGRVVELVPLARIHVLD